jgi:hypothetical protein
MYKAKPGICITYHTYSIFLSKNALGLGHIVTATTNRIRGEKGTFAVESKAEGARPTPKP